MKPETIDSFCRSLPAVTHDIKWGNDEVYSVGAKMFCVLSHDADGRDRLSFKVEPERFLELTDQPGIIPAPYLARHHWICLQNLDVLPDAELLAFLQNAHTLVAAKLPRKTRIALGLLNT